MTRAIDQFPRQASTPAADELESLLTVEEAAELLHVGKRWVYGHAKPGANPLLPYVKVGRYTRFRESALVAWLDRQTGGSKK